MQEKKPKKVLKNMLFSPRQLEMMADIAEETGLDNFSGNVHFCISQQWKRMFPAYVRNINDPDTIQKKALAKAKSKEAVEKMQEDDKRNKKVSYCEQIMRGKVDGDVCIYTQYGLKASDDSEETCPLSHLDNIVTENDCFYYGKEATLANRKDVAKIYEN